MKAVQETRSGHRRRALEEALYRAVDALDGVDELRRFFHDLATPAELEALADRWAVVALLKRGMTYREIHERTGVSVTTVGRVARVLMEGHGGYDIAYERLAPGQGAG